MVPSKLLIGSVVGVGSVSTAAVVAHQQGFFSLPGSQTQSSNNTADTGTPNNSGSESTISQPPAADSETPPAKPNQKAVEKWLTDNDTGKEDWKIQIKKGEKTHSFKETEIEENDLDGLKDYLDTNTELLKSFISSLETKSLTFDKSSNNWKHILTKENIEKWVEKTSQKKATLKLSEANTPKQLADAQIDLNKLLGDLFKEKSAFEGITTDQANPTKNILFEKVENDWKHSKKEITTWLSTDSQKKLTIQIKKGEGNGTDLEKTNEEDLVGLLNYLKTTTKETLFKFTGDSTPTPLTLKKDTNNWDVVHSETTVKNWIKNNHSGTQATLEFYEENAKKTITGDDEWKTFFNSIKDDTTLFSDSTKTKVIFEKVDGTWKHIKAAIKNWLESSGKGENKLKVQIKKESAGALDWDNTGFKDEDWIGLLKHLKTSGTSYISEGASSEAPSSVTLQKNSDQSDWTKFTNPSGSSG